MGTSIHPPAARCSAKRRLMAESTRRLSGVPDIGNRLRNGFSNFLLRFPSNPVQEIGLSVIP